MTPPFNNIRFKHYVLFMILINENVANHLKTIRRKMFNNSITIRNNIYNNQISKFIGINLHLN